MGDHIETKRDQILILQPWPQPKDLIERLETKYPRYEVVYKNLAFDARGTDVSDAIYQDAVILFTLFTFPAPSSAPRLKLVHLSSAGADRAIQSSLFKDTEIPFTNSSGVHGPQITEWVIMGLLNSTHHYNHFYEKQKEHSWDRGKAWNITDLAGQRIGILGYGSIGRQTARVAQALGMDVLAYTASPRNTPEERRDTSFVVPGTGDPDGLIPSKWFSGTAKENLHDFLNQDLDALVVSVPLTPATRGLLSTKEFDILSKQKTFVSNIARGPIIDSVALRVALEKGQLRGAALDVTDPEPLPSDDPLWDAPNVFITPHVSGNTTRYMDRSFQVLEQNLGHLAQGEKLINIVDRRKGY